MGPRSQIRYRPNDVPPDPIDVLTNRRSKDNAFDRAFDGAFPDSRRLHGGRARKCSSKRGDGSLQRAETWFAGRASQPAIKGPKTSV